MERRAAVLILAVMWLTGGCGWLFADRTPATVTPADVKHVVFDVVARGNRCEPSVMAVDREGRAVMVTFRVISVGKEHIFLIPDLFVRRTVPADNQVDIQLLADRSGIYEYACNSQPWIGPFVTTGKLAIK